MNDAISVSCVHCKRFLFYTVYTCSQYNVVCCLRWLRANTDARCDWLRARAVTWLVKLVHCHECDTACEGGTAGASVYSQVVCSNEQGDNSPCAMATEQEL